MRTDETICDWIRSDEIKSELENIGSEDFRWGQMRLIEIKSDQIGSDDNRIDPIRWYNMTADDKWNQIR